MVKGLHSSTEPVHHSSCGEAACSSVAERSRHHDKGPQKRRNYNTFLLIGVSLHVISSPTTTRERREGVCGASNLFRQTGDAGWSLESLPIFAPAMLLSAPIAAQDLAINQKMVPDRRSRIPRKLSEAARSSKCSVDASFISGLRCRSGQCYCSLNNKRSARLQHGEFGD